VADQQSRQPERYAGIPRERIAWYPTIDPERCRPGECQLNCIAACPQHVYERAQDGRVMVARPYDCTVGDISCSFQCPFEAISFPSQGELRRMLKKLREELSS
jgi:NAD-dependent dihydropyrimidine dehydrogenase PreA subunit